MQAPSETVKKVDGCLITDSRNVYDKLNTEVLTVQDAEKKANLELLSVKESQMATNLKVRWVHSEAQLANALTKRAAKISSSSTRCILCGGLWKTQLCARPVHDDKRGSKC